MYLRRTSVDACGGLQVLPYRYGLTGLIIPVRKTCQLGQLKGVGERRPPARLLQPPLYGVYQLGEVGKAIQMRTAVHDLYGAVRSMLSESAEPNLTTSAPSFSPT
jgi:hypothetical protein